MMILRGKQLDVTSSFTKYSTTWDGDKLHQLNLYGTLQMDKGKKMWITTLDT